MEYETRPHCRSVEGVAVLTAFFSDVRNGPQRNINNANKSNGVPDVFSCLEKGKFALLAQNSEECPKISS